MSEPGAGSRGFPVLLTGSIPPCLSFPPGCTGTVIRPGSQPGLRALNSCFVPAALLGRCSGKANIPRPGVSRLAAPSLPPPRGTGRGAPAPPSCPPCPGGSLRGPHCSPRPQTPGCSTSFPLRSPARGSGARADPGAGGIPRAGPSLRVPRGPGRVLPRSWAGVRGRGAVRGAFLTYLRAPRASAVPRRRLRAFTARPGYA